MKIVEILESHLIRFYILIIPNTGSWIAKGISTVPLTDPGEEFVKKCEDPKLMITVEPRMMKVTDFRKEQNQWKFRVCNCEDGDELPIKDVYRNSPAIVDDFLRSPVQPNKQHNDWRLLNNAIKTLKRKK